MSDALTGALAEALAELMAAVAACDDEVLDPGTAARWREGAAAALGGLPPADRRTLDGLLRAAALRHPEGPRRDGLLAVPAGLGLPAGTAPGPVGAHPVATDPADLHAAACEAVADRARRFAEAVRDADPATPVPARPGWTLADLVWNLGALHHWAGHLVRTRAAARVRVGDLTLGLPGDPAAYPDWFAGVADATVRTLRAADPAAPVWSPGGDPRVRSYPYRLLRETLVHLADAETALGGEPGPLDPRTAADALDHFLADLPYVPRPAEALARLGRDGSVIRLVARDTGTVWTLVLGGGGIARTHRTGADPTTPAAPAPAPDAPAARVEAGTGELLLLLHGRLAADDPRLGRSGDAGLLDAWLAATAL